MLLVVCGSLFAFVAYCSLMIVCCLLCVDRGLLLGVCWRLLIDDC